MPLTYTPAAENASRGTISAMPNHNSLIVATTAKTIDG
jgi:hypothetical protein